MSRSDTLDTPDPLVVPLIDTARRTEADLVGWRVDRLRSDLAGPLCVVGAGGSRTVAVLWAALHRRAGQPASTPSPLELHLDPPIWPVLLLSGSGRHHDMLGAADAALAAGGPVHGVTTRAEAPLIDRLRGADPRHHTLALTGPTVREGLAARHALVPMAVLAARLYGVDGQGSVDAFAATEGDAGIAQALVAEPPGDIVVLGAGLARGAAEVFAHLMRESGLAPARAADPREFAHGQFVAVGPRTRLVVFGLHEQTWLRPFVAALPSDAVFIEPRGGPLGALALYGRALHAAGVAMSAAEAKPGREAIPPWGAAIYRMPVDRG